MKRCVEAVGMFFALSIDRQTIVEQINNNENGSKYHTREL